MTKPVVFFSHSSKDAEALGFLKHRFLELTQHTIDVFLASDGQSIPLGANWVSSIEEALKKAKLMFVFVTPNSFRSPWLHFEAGHAYSKKIAVVPTALFGAEVGNLRPPLSLLQGFNVTGSASLDNLIARSNEVLGTNHAPGFTEEDFSRLINAGPVETIGLLGQHWAAMDFLELRALHKAPAALWPIPGLYEMLKTSGKLVDDLDCSIPGALIRLVGDGVETPDTPPPDYSFQAELDPGLAHVALPVVEPLFQKLTEPSGGALGYGLKISFAPGVNGLVKPHLIMARLYGTKVRIPNATSKWFRFGDLAFGLDRSFAHTQQVIVRPDLHMRCFGSSFAEADMRGLLDLLFDRGVLSY